MPKFKVQSGEYEIVVAEKTLRKAAEAAIQLHDKRNDTTKLGELTLVEKLDRRGQPQGDATFINTQQLIEENTSGFGNDDGQYSRIE